MKKHYSGLISVSAKINPFSKFFKISGIGLLLFFGVIIGAQSQVTFTQTTDADFYPGYMDNVLISGNNVYLATKATAINNWLSTTDLPQTLSGHQSARWKNYIYMSGGFNGTDYSNSVYRATLSGTGNGSWISYDTLPEPLRNHAMVVGLNYLYVIGGRTNGMPSDKIYYAKINSDGTLGTWTLSAITLPQALWGHTAHFQNGFIYIVGGTNSDLETSAVNTVYYAKKTGLSGELSTFSLGAALPDSRNGHAMAFYNEQLIVTGGYDNGGTKQSTVYYSPLNLDGTNEAWSSSTLLTEAVSNHSTTCYNGLITIIGGETSGGLSDKIYYADIDNLPTLTWNLAADLLYEARKNGNAYTYNGVVIFAGGENISGLPIHNTRYAPVTLGSEKVHSGTFLSNPFLQLGEERDIISLSYNITYNSTFNNYSLVYRTAGMDQTWGNWTEMNQDNPALVGEQKQYIQYLIQYDGTDDDNIVLHDMSINISGYTQLTGNLNGIDTLKLENSPYWVTGNISFTGGTHVVEAGVNILFSTNTGLEIGQANMSFEGTAADPITLTSFTSEAGVWNGVYFNTNSDNSVSSQMDYVVIEKAGSGSWNANLYCVSTNEPQINNCNFSMAEGHGIRLNDADLSMDVVEISNNMENGIYNQNSSPSLSNTDMLTNGNAGLYLYDLTSNPNFFNCNLVGNYFGIYYPSPNYSFPEISGINSYSNTISGIAMGGGTISSDQIWPYNSMGYAVVGDVTIALQNSHSRLTIAPGNTVYFDSLVQIQVGEYYSYNNFRGGELFAIGKPDSLITFTSINGQSGGWDGIYFHDFSDSFGSVSELKNCIIQNGNSYNIRCEITLQPRIDSCIITNAMNHDISVQDPNSVPYITASTSTVYIDGGTQSINKTWYNFGGEYVVVGDIIVALQNTNSTLTIEPGITVKLDTSVMIQIGEHYSYNNFRGGEIIAEGTVDSLITFTSLNGLVGGWDGIYFHPYSDDYGASSSMKYCTIEKGKDFNIKSNGSTEPRIDLCTITNSEGYDIYAVAPNDVQYITNTVSTVYVGAGTQSINKTWYNFGGEYIVVGDIIVAKQNTNSTLTIEPGITVKLDTSVFIQIGEHYSYNNFRGGEIIAEGSSDSLITFTSLNGLIGGWDGIYFHPYSDDYGAASSMKYCTIEKGKDFNIKSNGSTEPRIDSCTITNSDGYDIYATTPNDVQHITNTVSTVYVGAGTQSINKTWYNFGGEYIVVGDITVAKQNLYSTLTIEPGITVKLDSSVIIQIGEYYSYNNFRGGEIIAEGTHDSLINFTSLNPITGRWDGIYFHEFADNYGSNSSFKYCIIEGSVGNNLYMDGTNNVSFQHATFTDSKLAGINLNNSSPYLKLCQAINNDSIGILLTGSSHPVIGDTLGWGCDIFGNGDFGIYNSTNNLIHAKNNFWNTTDSATIAGMIYDNYDDGAFGIVEFMPFATTSFFDNLPPNEFNLISLVENHVTSDQTPSFSWEAATEPDGDAVNYHFYYTDDITWSSNIIVSEELTDPNYTIPETLTGGKYYWWKVKASDGYLTTNSNQVRTFAVSLPPTIPTPIVPSNGSLIRENDFIVWLTTTDPDEGDFVSHYRLQLDDDSDFSSPEIDANDILLNGKGSSISIQISKLPGYLNLENRNYYWRISATDGFGVESDFSDGSNYFLYILDVSAKVFLDGPFNGVMMNTTLNDEGLLPLSQPYNGSPWNYMTFESVESIPANAVDWILLELRSTTDDVFSATSDKIIYQKAAFVLSDGTVANLDGSSIFEFPISFDDNVYLVIHHRNHLSIISNFELSPDLGAYFYDFSTGSDKVYGGTAGYSEISSGIWGMSGGDANADSTVDMFDKNVDWKNSAGTTGYIYTDMNLDGQVDNPDKNEIWLSNDGKGSQVPD